jgi:hypothetical protein
VFLLVLGADSSSGTTCREVDDELDPEDCWFPVEILLLDDPRSAIGSKVTEGLRVALLLGSTGITVGTNGGPMDGITGGRVPGKFPVIVSEGNCNLTVELGAL